MRQYTQEELSTALKYHFGHEEFRPFQLDAIQATLAGRDSLLVLPTGGGKSMTFQLPALAKGNCFTVVVGPLMALAKDQVDSCLDLGIDARVWNSDTSEEARRSIQSDLVSDAPEMRLLYTTPESLRHPNLRGYLKEAYDSGTLLSFAIDEAHCVSDWGHEFRPAYLELASLRQDFPDTPIAAMTASCTPTVEAGIVQLLKLKDPLLIKGGFNRPNIQYQVLYKELINDGKQDDLAEHLVDFIKQREGQCGIIYARLRATCDWLGSALGNCDLDVGVYHAGKDAARRRKVQSDWCDGGLDIVVATVAFGMGIDRADVRWVVHWDVPASLEGYYQESGRAGRDGQPSEAVLYVSADDLDTLTKLEKGNRSGSAAAVASFSCRGGCKRKQLLEYFGQRRCPCDAGQGELLCDYCSQPVATRQLIQQWEQQLQRKAVAHVLRQQQEAAGQAGADSDDGADGRAAGAVDDGAGGSSAAAAATTGGQAGWQAGSTLTSTVRSSSIQQRNRPWPGVWAPARAHCGAAAVAAAPDRWEPAVGGSNAAAAGAALQDENTPPGKEASSAPAPGDVTGSAVGGVLVPGHAAQQAAISTTAAAAAAATKPQAPAEKPHIKKRRLSRGQQQPWAAFKAPRQQLNTAIGAESSSLGHGHQGHAPYQQGMSDAEQLQQPEADAAQAWDKQQQAQQVTPPAGEAAEAVCLAQQSLSSGAFAARVVLKKPPCKRGTARQAFVPPLKKLPVPKE